MRPRRALAALAAAVALLTVAAAPALGAGAAHRLDPLSVQANFMCTSCHEPLPQVNSPEAQDEKDTIVELIDKGYTLPQIKSAMVEIYGQGVLAQPPAQGFNLLIYILPPVLVVAGLGLLAYTLPKWRARSRGAAGGSGGAGAGTTAVPPLAPEDEQRLDEELERFA